MLNKTDTFFSLRVVVVDGGKEGVAGDEGGGYVRKSTDRLERVGS